MDQGIAAVLGAGVGIFGTLASGLIGHVTARHQTRNQGRLDHGVRLRDERRSVYTEFLDKSEQVLQSISSLHGCLVEPDEFSEPNWFWIERILSELKEDRNVLSSIRTRVIIVGPAEVEKRANEFCISLAYISEYGEPLLDFQDISSSTQPRFDELLHVADTKLRLFVTAVRDVLVLPPLR